MLHWGAPLLLVPHSDRQFSVAGRNGRVYDAHGRGPPHVLNIYLNNPPWPENEGVPNWQGHQAVPISAIHRSKPTQRIFFLHQGRGSVIPAAPCLRPVVDVAASYTLAHCGRDSDCGYDGVCGSDGRCRCHFSRAGTV